VKTLDTMSAQESDARLQKFYDAMVASGYLVAIPIVVLAHPLVRVLFGSAYQRTAPVLQAHVASMVFIAVGVARGRYLVARNHLGFIAAAAVLGAVVNVALNLLWLPRYGAMGAAWATVAAYATSNYLSGFLWRPVWHQTALLTRALLLPIRALRMAASRVRRPS
jgi:O-antigen/teichoic acid export membrane protein